MAGASQRSGDYSCGQAKRRIIDDIQRLVIGAGAHDAGNRGEHLFSIDAPVILCVGNQTGGHIIAVMRQRQAFATAQNLAAFTACQINIFQIFSQLCVAYDRTNLRAILKRMANRQRLCCCQHLVDKLVMHGIMNDDP